MRSDNKDLINKHAFEVAGLGKAPFRFIGFEYKTYKAHPDAPEQCGGSCDFCGTAIKNFCYIESADGKRSKVGTNCISKVNETGIIKAYKSSPEWRAHQAAIRNHKSQKSMEVLELLITDRLSAFPHPQGFKDFKTGAPLTLRDYALWMLDNAGHSGRQKAIAIINRIIK